MLAPLPAVAPVTPVWEMVQLNVVPATLLVRSMSVVSPEHNVCVAGVAVATGIGFTVTVTTIGIPSQPFAVGVIVYVTVPVTDPVVESA